MKKYVKPDLYYENFELSHSIASCYVGEHDIDNDGKLHECTNLQDGNTCNYDLGGGIIVFASNCDENYTILGENYCYQTNAEGFVLFRS